MEKTLRPIQKLMIANRGEIAIRILRAATELKIRTVAIFTYEDRYSLHRYKADEAYRIGKYEEPLKPYLDIEEIIHVAKKNGVDAIHPGYGFLSENVNFARRCREEGIIFVGPAPEVMEQLGDKIAAKKIARAANVPVIEDSQLDLSQGIDIAIAEARRIGFPVILKASAGGGGRGMRVAKSEADIEKMLPEAQKEALNAFGDGTIFIEKFIENPKHIEVQIMADNYGNMVHLYERDCSVQRRFQKVVEIAPSVTLTPETRKRLFNYALAICRKVNYNNVGTVEFLVDADEKVYFIEVNPRVQVEHTITEVVTSIDIVRSQILIAEGHLLSDDQIYIWSQDDIRCNGYAIQCRITTEDPENNFKPDYGKIIAYRNASGFGIRLDEGSCYQGATISPFFDSMLVKISASGRTLSGASERLYRSLIEFRIRGVKTNVGFLLNVISHPVFRKGQANVNFIPDHPELFNIQKPLDRATRLLAYIADVTINGNPDVSFIDKNKKFRTPQVPEFSKMQSYPKGTKDMLTEMGRDKFIEWLKNDTKIHYTDTTFRDAHQSLLATRVRIEDIRRVAESFAKHHPEVFSMEVWGGATFDVCMRFLKESPWQRLQRIRKAIPNILLQMLIRGANAVGYTAYPDNLIEKFIEKSWENGVDIFRIFDSLNWLEGMKVSIRAVRERTGGIAEACICYTGDILNKGENKFNLNYYLDLAKRLEDEGAHILCIKDMAGLLKPFAAEVLIAELKNTVQMPIHLHTHDTSSIQAATYLKAIEAGVDVIDVALASMSGLTSQPNFNSIVAFMQYHHRHNPINLEALNGFSNYWEDVREYYYPFESDLKAGTAEVYENEIPGGQYSNLRPQARGLGLEHKFEQIKKNYAVANRLFGDIVKVTPSSKVVGDLALFMTSNDLSEEDIWAKGHLLSFPESVKGMLRGDLGQPQGGFPEKLQQIVLKGEQPYTDLPNAHLAPVDFEAEFETFQRKFDKQCDELDFLSYKFYPKVFEEFYTFYREYADVSYLPTTTFFYGMQEDEEIIVKIAEGKVLIVKMVSIGKPDEDGMRRVIFELNGTTRQLSIRDKSVASKKILNAKIEPGNPNHIGAPLQGKLADVLVKAGDSVRENTPLFVIEAMKMESTILATAPGKIARVVLDKGTMVGQDDLVVVLEAVK
jgi:pyruvate carboxylase